MPLHLPGLLLAGALGPTAQANGQTTHIWITRHALTHLPDGELEPMLVHGSMFPDEGSTPGIALLTGLAGVARRRAS